MDTDHLAALYNRLSNEKARPICAIRSVWISQIQKEIADEEQRLGIKSECELTEDELLDALMA